MSPPSAVTPFPLDQADLCVKCGLCLPHCPTYALTAQEGDSPRGRIAMMQGLAIGALNSSTRVEAHLDGCLGCRNCEKVCPAQVPYGVLIDAGRTLLAQQRPQRTRSTRAMGTVLAWTPLWRVARSLLWIYARSGVQSVVRQLHLLGCSRLARLESLLPSNIERRLTIKSVEHMRASVQLFAGCASSIADQATLNATRRLCNRLGIEIEEPTSQTCCGALYQHAGMPDQAHGLVTRNLDAFPGTSAIAWCATGCGATLRDYGRLSVDPRAAAFASRATDIHEVLARHWPSEAKLNPLAARVLLHLPCTQRNVTGGSQIVLALLRRIPQLEIELLDASGGCCGAAGSYFVTQPDTADRLLADRLARVEKSAPDYILSSNIGCALHLAGGLRRRGLKVPVLHPVQLLERQLAE